ncbi:MAG: cobalamin-binding protein [Chitinivibrionales bacterium]|nr:cobalamin-binding protein [Chitinivibrionales bacterium]MBD3394704.1 cobalamin-binding protein [Chitinivibrionales bacterium]
MSEILEQIATCVERGKINAASPYPPDMKGQEGADELTRKAIDGGTAPTDILEKALVVGMQKIGEKFAANKVFVPDVLMAAKSMNAAMAHLRPFFQSGEVKRKGVFCIGTVQGDLHDIGKNLVSMIVEGGGWEVVDLGVDVSTEKFIEAVEQHPGCAVGLSALLTTTMINMEKTVKALKEKTPGTKVLIGGAPLTQEFCTKIGADCYSADPQGAVEYLNKLAA